MGGGGEGERRNSNTSASISAPCPIDGDVPPPAAAQVVDLVLLLYTRRGREWELARVAEWGQVRGGVRARRVIVIICLATDSKNLKGEFV